MRSRYRGGILIAGLERCCCVLGAGVGCVRLTCRIGGIQKGLLRIRKLLGQGCQLRCNLLVIDSLHFGFQFFIFRIVLHPFLGAEIVRIGVFYIANLAAEILHQAGVIFLVLVFSGQGRLSGGLLVLIPLEVALIFLSSCQIRLRLGHRRLRLRQACCLCSRPFFRLWQLHLLVLQLQAGKAGAGILEFLAFRCIQS